MSEEIIKQRAEKYATEHYDEHDYTDHSGCNMCHAVSEKAYIAGAQSMLPEIDELKGEVKYLKEALSARKAEIIDMQFLRKQDKELLNNATSMLKDMLKDIYEDYGYFCEKLLDIPEEEKICAAYCDKEGVQCDCILRYLKHYKKE